MQPRFSTVHYSLAYNGVLNLTCQGANNLIRILCHEPIASSSMTLASGLLKRINNQGFTGEFRWHGRGKNTTGNFANAHITILGINYSSKTLAPGETWIFDASVHIFPRTSILFSGGIFLAGTTILESSVDFIGTPA